MNENERNRHVNRTADQDAEAPGVEPSLPMKSWWRLGKTPLWIVPLSVFTACGPIGGDDWSTDAGVGGSAPVSTGGVGWGDDYGYGASASGGAGTPAGGQSGYCDVIAPQKTHVCSGWAYESEEVGAAGLRVIAEMCGDPYYGGAGGAYGSGGGFSTGGIGFGGDDGVSTGGADYGYGASFSAGVGGDVSYGAGGEAYYGAGGEAYYGAGGEAYYGVGGQYYPGTGGQGAGGGGNPSHPRWCDSDPGGTVLGGISFAVGSCQDVDVALPLLFKEPYGAEFELVVYGAHSPCDRGYPITSAAGIGTGQVLEIPFSTAGYSFISVEVRSEAYADFGIRLRDRPRVVPMPSE